MKRLMFLTLSLLIPCFNQAMDAGKELQEAALILGGGAATAYAFSKAAERISNRIDKGATQNEDMGWIMAQSGRILKTDKWGGLGTWWVGLPFYLAARIGGSHQLSAQELIKPVAIAYAVNAIVALGYGAYVGSKEPNVEKKKAVGVREGSFASRLMGTFAPLGAIGFIIYKRITHHH